MTITSRTTLNSHFYLLDGQWLYSGGRVDGHYATELIAIRDRLTGKCYALKPYGWLTQEFMEEAFGSLGESPWK